MATLKMGSTTVLTDTTLANAVQDNVTRLGTVTAATLGSDVVMPSGVQKIDLFSYVLEDAPTTTYNNTIGTFNFTPNRNSTKQIYWWNLITRSSTGYYNSGYHIYIEFDIYDNDASAVKIDAQVLAGGSFPTGSAGGNYNGIGSHVTSTTALTEGVSYKMRIWNVSSAVNYTGTNDTYGNDLTMTALCFE